MDSGLLSLKWNNHRSSFVSVLNKLCGKDLYCDVRIACEGKFFSCHKLVLSTCSEYFEDIFKHIDCKCPIIVLKDIKSKDFEALLNYMYIGEVNVLQKELSTLIKSAESLKIKGLAVPDDEPLEKVQEVKRKRIEPDKIEEAKHQKIDVNTEIALNTAAEAKNVQADKVNNLTLSNLKQTESENEESEEDDYIKVEALNFENTSEDFTSENKMYSLQSKETESQEWWPGEDTECLNEDPFQSSQNDENLLCNKKNNSESANTTRRNNQLLESGKKSVSQSEDLNLFEVTDVDLSNDVTDIQASITEGGLPKFKCRLCSYSTTHKSNLKRHMRTHSGEKPFSCTYCSYKCAQSNNLKAHIFSKHGDLVAAAGNVDSESLAVSLYPVGSTFVMQAKML